jgi:hypothetical protein
MALGLLRTGDILLKVGARVLDTAAVIARDERFTFPVQADGHHAVAVGCRRHAGLGDDVAFGVVGLVEC